MKKQLKQSAYLLFHILVASYTLLLLGFCTFNTIVYAQTHQLEDSNRYRIGTLEERMTIIEGLKLDQRLIRIETILGRLEDRDWTSNLANGGVGLLLVRALYVTLRKRGITE